MSESKENLSESKEKLTENKEILPTNPEKLSESEEKLSESSDKLSETEERMLESASRIQSMQRRKIRLRNAFESDEQGSRIKTRKQRTVVAEGCGTTIPYGFSDLLELISREVLRSQPMNIVEFIANLLANLVDVRDGRRDSKNLLASRDILIPPSLILNNLEEQ